jgi:hypothetical protein
MTLESGFVSESVFKTEGFHEFLKQAPIFQMLFLGPDKMNLINQRRVDNRDDLLSHGRCIGLHDIKGQI